MEQIFFRVPVGAGASHIHFSYCKGTTFFEIGIMSCLIFCEEHEKITTLSMLVAGQFLFFVGLIIVETVLLITVWLLQQKFHSTFH